MIKEVREKMRGADLRDRAFTAEDFTSNWKRLHDQQTIVDGRARLAQLMSGAGVYSGNAHGRTVKEALNEIYEDRPHKQYHCTYCNTLSSTFDKNCRNCGSSIRE